MLVFLEEMVWAMSLNDKKIFKGNEMSLNQI